MTTAATAPGPELRDIHLPPAPSWWPPAPGWWVLAALVLIGGYFAVRWWLRRRDKQRWRKRVLAELERIASDHVAQPDPTRVAADVSHLLRRVSLMIQPQAAALRDEAWLEFLDAQWPPARAADTGFRGALGRSLLDAPYRRAGNVCAPMFDAHALLDLSRTWLRAVLPAALARRSSGTPGGAHV